MLPSYLNAIDYTVISVYVCGMIGLGVYLKQKASASLENYLVGGRSIPWWMLGISGMSQYFDVAGTTMVTTSFLLLLGPRGLFIEFRGGASLILVVMLLWTGNRNSLLFPEQSQACGYRRGWLVPVSHFSWKSRKNEENGKRRQQWLCRLNFKRPKNRPTYQRSFQALGN